MPYRVFLFAKMLLHHRDNIPKICTVKGLFDLRFHLVKLAIFHLRRNVANDVLLPQIQHGKTEIFFRMGNLRFDFGLPQSQALFPRFFLGKIPTIGIVIK